MIRSPTCMFVVRMRWCVMVVVVVVVCVSVCEREPERAHKDECSCLLRKASPYTIQESRWSLFFFFLKNDGKCNFPGIDPLGNLQRAMWGMSGGAGTGWGVQ